MRLYLSSYKFGEPINELVKLVGTQKRVAIIMNALDAGDPVRVAESVEKQALVFASLGLHAEQLDLRNYFGKSGELKTVLGASYGLVWVCGGNSFVLKRAYEQSGFDKIITKLLQEDAIVYGGFSAGVVVMTPTLKGVEIVDDPEVVPVGYKKDFDYRGLKILDFVVAMHYKSDHPESAAVNRYVEFCAKEKIPYKTLRDGEVIVINGEIEKLFAIK